jgi:hypothetical protein
MNDDIMKRQYLSLETSKYMSDTLLWTFPADAEWCIDESGRFQFVPCSMRLYDTFDNCGKKDFLPIGTRKYAAMSFSNAEMFLRKYHSIQIRPSYSITNCCWTVDAVDADGRVIESAEDVSFVDAFRSVAENVIMGM